MKIHLIITVLIFCYHLNINQAHAKAWTITPTPYTLQTPLSIQSQALMGLMSSTHQPKDEWYGLRLMISDIGTLGIFLLPINNDAKAALGITHTVVTPLIIHALSVNENMRSNRVLRAIGLRIGLPIAGGLLGYGIANLIGATNPHTGEAFGGVIIGAVLASLTGSIADYILARRPIKH